MITNKFQIRAAFVIILLFAFTSLFAKTLPDFMSADFSSSLLTLQKKNLEGLYDISKVETVYLEFQQSNWWNLLKANYNSGVDLPATLKYKEIVLDSVGVRFRGQTSYQMVKTSQKLSFNISTDFIHDGQRLLGFKTLNLNNCYDDPSFMREVLYNGFAGRYIPSAYVNFVRLVINGQNWGVYANVQQLNGDFYNEWFMSNEGTNWRADYPDTSTAKQKPGIPGGNFGAGFCSLNDLGDNPIIYTRYYTLKSAKKEDPWTDLMTSCHYLNTLADDELYDSLKYYLDVDRSLWHIAVENLFTDDDGYVNKGGMDYYVYYDVDTKRLTPIEYDGNSTFTLRNATWQPFLKATDTKYPLINRLLANKELKQRYAAHVRTILNEAFRDGLIDSLVVVRQAQIDTMVRSDTKKLYTYTSFTNSIKDIKNFIYNRKSTLMNDAVISAKPPVINEVVKYLKSGNSAPSSDEAVTIRASITCDAGIKKVNLYFGTGLMGTFDKIEMFDDGNHNDLLAGDGIYGADIPMNSAGVYVRYYVEAISANNFGTASFSPEGAEHDVYFYQVQTKVLSSSKLVINEFMASNSATIADPQGEFDDWIEIFNGDAADANLTGMYLSDKTDNLKKWKFPDNTIIKPGEYLIIWADENSKATPGIHCNFKLSGDGEVIFLVDSDANSNSIIDSVSFGVQTTDISTGRYPNGTGHFVNMNPTPGAYNDNNLQKVEDRYLAEQLVSLYPMPFSDNLNISFDVPESGFYSIQIIDLMGNILNTLKSEFLNNEKINLKWNGTNQLRLAMPDGSYFLKIQSEKINIISPIIKISE